MSDSELVNIGDRASTAISLGESHFREFKSALHGPPNAKVPREYKSICRDVGEALVAFANADGGELLVGVEDEGTVSGVESLPEAAIEAIVAAPKTHVHERTPLPPVRTARLIIENHTVLYFSLFKSTTFVHLTSDGRCVQRLDLQSVPIPAEEIQFGRRERNSREYDRQFVDGAVVNDLNREHVRAVADQISPGMSIEKCLQYLDLAEYANPGMRLRRAALLLFANEPSRWHPRLQVRIMKVEGAELKTGPQYNVKSDQTVTGNILELLEKAWEALRPQLVQTRLGNDARFGTTIMYPELACREALVNAIGHRDYSEEGRGIEIYVFDDRMQVRNPGALLSTLTIEDLKRLEGTHQSRNASTARVLRELGYMRELGEGMRRMFELMKVNELTSPEIESDSSSFCVTLRHSTIYTTAQKLWLDQFSQFNLSREQKALVVLGIGGGLVSPQQVWESLGIVDTEHYRQVIKSLQDLGILHSEVSRAEAQRLAEKRRVPVREIPRFKIGAASRRSAEPSPPHGNVQAAVVWIGSLPPDLDERKLFEFLSSFGVVDSLSVPKDRGTGRSRGYAFVGFEGPQRADAIIARIDGQMFEGRHLVARPANRRAR